MKKIFYKLPEYYLLILAFLAGYTPPMYINPIFIGIMAIILLQIIYKNRISGMILGILFFSINLYFLGALFSEFNEFTKFNSNAQQLLFVGLPIWIVNIVLSSTMIYKYTIHNSINNSSQIELEKQNI